MAATARTRGAAFAAEAPLECWMLLRDSAGWLMCNTAAARETSCSAGAMTWRSCWNSRGMRQGSLDIRNMHWTHYWRPRRYAPRGLLKTKAAARRPDIRRPGDLPDAFESLQSGGCRALFAVLMTISASPRAGRKPNVLVIWGDDIGGFNIGAYNRGMMG